MDTAHKTPWNPSRRATARVKAPLPAPEQCRLCGGNVRIGEHAEVYGGRSFGDWPWVYLCDDCGAYVGLHPFTSIPLGTLADARIRAARKACKPAFEKLHRSGGMTRKQAYAALAERLGIPVDECHFGWFDLDMCEQARRAAEQLRKELVAGDRAGV